MIPRGLSANTSGATLDTGPREWMGLVVHCVVGTGFAIHVSCSRLFAPYSPETS